jgi:hypothetical protein
MTIQIERNNKKQAHFLFQLKNTAHYQTNELLSV